MGPNKPKSNNGKKTKNRGRQQVGIANTEQTPSETRFKEFHCPTTEQCEIWGQQIELTGTQVYNFI
ncbi:hypothetical protein CRE_29134 [Caenorhabditis remanei]|uniref:Homeobox domain-containing protein n=1 Tax=Caenorhabditis remanei TaxID=31234 RepID=E3N4J7_CAERE|nr:hypothetical protein CRE_29134 [Caenorhabditis remanei]